MSKVRIVRIVWKDVAREAGVSLRSVYAWRKNRRRSTVSTDEDIKAALASLYGVTIEDIQDQL